MKTMNLLTSVAATAVVSTMIMACGGGGGGTVYVPGGGGGSGGVISYPFETVYGDTCATFEPTPGCTFNKDGSRVIVNQDPDYNRYGYGRDDLWYVQFDYQGNATVRDDLGNLVDYKSISSFAGWVGGTTIGVGVSGLFWENVAGGTYWWGANGVLYSANNASNFGEAINNKSAGEASETSFAAMNSDSNKRLVRKGADKLVKDYGFTDKKAMAVASALNSWAVQGAERGYTTDKDMDKTFKSTFGVDFNSALAAVKDIAADRSNTGKMKDLTDRSAQVLGLKPDQAQKFIKGMYKKALSQWGIENVNW